MSSTETSLIIPVENQVRELDAKLLLACIAAQHGFPSVIGWRYDIDARIAMFPPSLYLSKSMTARSVKLFKILKLLGHKILVWDEEALVHYPPDTYFSRRLSAEAIKHVSYLFAWGQDNFDLFRQYPHLLEIPIYITGNPRGDMLRPELRPYYQDVTDELRTEYGDFVLINTNFGQVNAFLSALNLFKQSQSPGEEPEFGRGATGMSREFAEGLRDHKQAVFEDFQRLIPALEKAFPELTIVVRPHPVENREVYHEIAGRCSRVRVVMDGNVIPWLMACKAVIHNGCTTGIEAYVVRTPALAYQATVNDKHDNHLPNALSHQCFNFNQLQATLEDVLSGSLAATDGQQRENRIKFFLAAQHGPLACQRIVEVLKMIRKDNGSLPVPIFKRRVAGWSRATKRRVTKAVKARYAGSKYSFKYQRLRYPTLTLEQMQDRIVRLQQLVGGTDKVKINRIANHVFRICGRDNYPV